MAGAGGAGGGGGGYTTRVVVGSIFLVTVTEWIKAPFLV